MRVYPIALVALALIAGTAGYVAHQMMAGGNSAQSASYTDRENRVSSPITTGAESPSETGADNEVSVKPAMNWAFTDLEGKSQPLAQWHDKITVLNFWATWCPPCLREIPAFVDLQSRYGEDGLNFVGIALDHAEVVAPFVSDKAMNYPVVVGDQQVVKFMQSLGNAIGGLPYTAVIDSRGDVVYTHQGEWEAEAAEALLQELLDRS